MNDEKKDWKKEFAQIQCTFHIAHTHTPIHNKANHKSMKRAEEYFANECIGTLTHHLITPQSRWETKNEKR